MNQGTETRRVAVLLKGLPTQYPFPQQSHSPPHAMNHFRCFPPEGVEELSLVAGPSIPASVLTSREHKSTGTQGVVSWPASHQVPALGIL